MLLSGYYGDEILISESKRMHKGINITQHIIMQNIGWENII